MAASRDDLSAVSAGLRRDLRDHHLRPLSGCHQRNPECRHNKGNLRPSSPKRSREKCTTWIRLVVTRRPRPRGLRVVRNAPRAAKSPPNQALHQTSAGVMMSGRWRTPMRWAALIFTIGPNDAFALDCRPARGSRGVSFRFACPSAGGAGSLGATPGEIRDAHTGSYAYFGTARIERAFPFPRFFSIVVRDFLPPAA